MCGRFTLRTPPADWCQMFLIDIDEPSENGGANDKQRAVTDVADEKDEVLNRGWQPRYNIAPTQTIAAVVQEQAGGARSAASFRWGLLPPWAKELSVGARMINARSETVDEKPSFRKAFAERRCLIPADGYIEWKREADRKQPFLAHRADQGVFAFAGLYERNKQATGQWIESCTILTTAPNEITGQIHDRMPVVLPVDNHARWLDPAYRDTDTMKKWLIAPENNFFEITAVSRRVNNARHDDADCLQPIDQT